MSPNRRQRRPNIMGSQHHHANTAQRAHEQRLEKDRVLMRSIIERGVIVENGVREDGSQFTQYSLGPEIGKVALYENPTEQSGEILALQETQEDGNG